MAMDAQQIYDNFHGADAKGVGGLDHVQQTSYNLANSYRSDAVDTQKLINDIGAGWTGTASEAAAQGLAPMAETLLSTGDALNTHQDLVYRQAQSYQRAASQVQPVPPQPSMVDIANLAMTGITTGNATLVSQAQSMYNQVAVHNAISQANVDAYDTYVRASTYNSTNLPTMAETMGDTISAPVTVSTTPPGGDAIKNNASPPSGRRSSAASGTADPGRRGDTATSTSTSNLVGTNTAPSPSLSPSSGAAPTTTISSADGASNATTAAPGGSSANSAVASGSGTGSGSTGGAAGITGGLISGAASGTGDLGGSGSSSGTQRATAGLVDEDAGGRAGSAPVEEEPGGRSSTAADSATAAEDEAMASERAATTPAAEGMVGGGRGGKGADDAEHKRKVVLTEDPDIFDGTGPAIAPVIGETREQYLARLARDAGESR